MVPELTDKQQKTLNELGANFFSFRECAIILEVESSKFTNEMKSPNSLAYKTYYSGFYASALKIRKSIMELAIRGSGPAQQQMVKMIDAAMAANK